MVLKVRTIWLVAPVVLLSVLVIAVVIGLNYYNVEQSTIGYDYKERLFNEDAVGTIDITISDDNWQKILDDPTAEEYVEASVLVNGEVYNNVGIRAKGNSSLTSVANSDSERYSLKVDFAQYDSNQTFYGLDTINLNNNFSDTTQMKEFVSYELMEQLGIATPAHSYVKVNVNGEYYGLMLAVEEVGEAFTKTNFGSTEGFIFKPEGDGSDLAYISEDVDDYPGIFDEVKMNKKTAEKNSNVISMMKQISEGDTSSIDIEQIAKYFALNTALVNLDSYQGSFKHNYYLYENAEGQFSIIPWDYNMSFGSFNMEGGGRPNGEAANVEGENANASERNAASTSEDKRFTNENEQFTSPGNGMQQRPTGQMPQQGGTNEVTPPANGNSQMQPPVNGNTGASQSPNNEPMNRNGGGMGGGLMLNETIVTDDSVNFTISEPVSGTTVEARPLLQIILQNEEARALYDMYLEHIATEILTEENVLAITTKLQNLLLEAVDEDPSKFSTTEQFIAGVSGEQSLPEFAKQRSESILKQLAGEIEGVSGASEGFGGGMPEMNGEIPNGGNMPEMNGEMPKGGNMPEMNGEMPNRTNGDQMQQGASTQTVNKKGIIITLVASLTCILLATAAVAGLSRKKYKRGRA